MTWKRILIRKTQSLFFQFASSSWVLRFGIGTQTWYQSWWKGLEHKNTINLKILLNSWRTHRINKQSPYRNCWRYGCNYKLEIQTHDNASIKRSRIDYHSHNTNFFQTKFFKLNFPNFEGGNPNGWIYKCNRFFKINRIGDHEKVHWLPYI